MKFKIKFAFFWDYLYALLGAIITIILFPFFMTETLWKIYWKKRKNEKKK